MLLGKILDIILERLSIRRIMLTTFLTFIESTLVVYFFKITNDHLVLMVTFICAGLTLVAITFYPISKSKKDQPPKRRKK